MQIPRLHPDTVDQVKQRADIYDVVSEYVVLRKRGKDYVGLCPFHDEKSPSFTVSPAKQMFYCFGCQAAGNSIKFLMDLQKRGFSDVVLDLARRYQVSVQTLAPEQRQELQRQLSLREQLYEVLAATARFYQHALKSPQNPQAMEYLREKRQFSPETIEQFSLGYAPAGWETLYRYLVEDKRYPVQLVEKAGLIKPRKENSGYYDVFRDRIMIPICDIMGRVIAFGGRTTTDEQPKYLNSPETELFSKGKTLFALDQAKNGIGKFDQAVVVEGYFDAIALHANGITNAVASLGTALSIDQVRMALRYSDSKQLVLNFDADKAGTNAAQRAIGEVADLAYKGELQLKVLNIPDGKDADDFLRSHSPQDYQQLLDHAPLWLDWQIQKITQDRDLKLASDFQQVSQELVKLLKNIANNDTRSYYVSHCAEILSLGDTRLIPLRVENLLTQITPKLEYRAKSNTAKSTSRKSPTTTKTEKCSLLEEAEALLLKIYLHCPGQREEIIDALDAQDLQFSFSHHRFLWQQILEITDVTGKDLISHVQDRCLEFADELSLILHLFHLDEISQKEIIRTPQVVQATVACMEKVLCEKRMLYFNDLWKKTDPELEPENYKTYYAAFYREKMRLQELQNQRLFSIIDLL
jgi:DNA primase